MSDLLADLQRLRSCFDRDVSELPDRWTAELPSTGCCHVAAVVLWVWHGGQIMRCEVSRGGFSTDTHYFNVIEGVWIDATADQFRIPWRISNYADATTEPLNDVTREKSGILQGRFYAMQVGAA